MSAQEALRRVFPHKYGWGCAARFMKTLSYFRSKRDFFPPLFFCLTQNWIPYFTLDSIFRWIVTKIVGFSWKGGIPNFTPNCTDHTLRPNWLKNSNLCRCKYLYSLHKEVPRISWYYRHAIVLLNHALWPTRYNGHFLLHRLKVCTTVCTKDASNGSMD